jgi:Winged helix-turn helix
VLAVSMSKKEFDRLEVLLGVRSGRLRVADACALLGLKRRQVFRLLAGLKHGGAASLVSKRRGRPSNNCSEPQTSAAGIAIIGRRCPKSLPRI